MKRIWFSQQAPFGHMPLRAGLGLITEEELRMHGVFNGTACHEAILKTHQRTCKSLTDIGYAPEMLCPKLYTTRTHPLSGEYFVVEGSRFKAKPVEPRIEFKVTPICLVDFKNKVFLDLNSKKFFAEWNYFTTYSPENGHTTFPEHDLGIKGVSFSNLRDELLRLNKKATIDTAFFINKLEPIGARTGA